METATYATSVLLDSYRALTSRSALDVRMISDVKSSKINANAKHVILVSHPIHRTISSAVNASQRTALYVKKNSRFVRFVHQATREQTTTGVKSAAFLNKEVNFHAVNSHQTAAIVKSVRAVMHSITVDVSAAAFHIVTNVQFQETGAFLALLDLR